MAELIWADKSVISLEDIYDYIADDSPHYARYQINSILKGAERLKTFPESGRHIPGVIGGHNTNFPEFTGR